MPWGRSRRALLSACLNHISLQRLLFGSDCSLAKNKIFFYLCFFLTPGYFACFPSILNIKLWRFWVTLFFSEDGCFLLDSPTVMLFLNYLADNRIKQLFWGPCGATIQRILLETRLSETWFQSVSISDLFFPNLSQLEGTYSVPNAPEGQKLTRTDWLNGHNDHKKENAGFISPL